MPPNLHARHIYVSICISHADSHSITSGAPNMLQTCAGPISITADMLNSSSSLLHNHRSALPNFSPSHSRCVISSPSTPAFLVAFRVSSDSLVPRCHVLIARFTSIHTQSHLMPFAKRNSSHVTRA